MKYFLALLLFAAPAFAEEPKKDIEQAVQLLSEVSVKGKDTLAMAQAFQLLQRAHQNFPTPCPMPEAKEETKEK